MQKGKDNKPHIGIFGRRNNGKSSLINNFTGQSTAIVSNIAGTTTDPVKKSVEIFGIGPSIIIDTAGYDDNGELGMMRIEKTLAAISEIDLAILLITNNIFDDKEKNIIENFQKKDVPFFIVHNKSDEVLLNKTLKNKLLQEYNVPIIEFSNTNPDIEKLVDVAKKMISETAYTQKTILGDLICSGDTILLITPIDSEAPEGRMILPQVQTLRDILDNDCFALVCKEDNVGEYIKKMQPKPSIAVTDSQVFKKISLQIPNDIPLTSFSILLARQKGHFENYLAGTPKISELKDNDIVLIMESCTHHISCEDIGRIKIPALLRKFTGKNLTFDIVSGTDIPPRDIHDYAIVIQCGGCVMTQKQLSVRIKNAINAGIPVSNYGMTIAFVNGIFDRATKIFKK